MPGRGWFLAAGLLTLAAPAVAGVPIPPAYRVIAEEAGVPPTILFAVSLAESRAMLRSGKRLPWPWTLNIEGRGFRYRSRQEAHAALLAALAEGRTVDIGLGQVNWQAHRARLGNPWQAFEPYFNLRLAAHLLREHKAGCPDWWCAVGRYHLPGTLRGRPPAASERRRRDYIARVHAQYQALTTPPLEAAWAALP